MFLLYVREFGRIGGLLLRNRPEDADIRRDGAGGSVSPIGGWPAWFFGCGIFQTAFEAV